ncbi:unnamed protein product [Somion occarium]|uniref:Uncharacterized protein n=1 Tax=Somion occarium TaxID=3059160 RepID=A0ABP1CPW1_9APHY
MIILDEKMALPPPPPYAFPEPVSPPPFPLQSRIAPTLATLPPHLLLRIVYETFSQTSSIERQRKTLYWLNLNLRRVCRAIYVACMHVLRSTFLPAYTAHIRPPYTSDPFPLTSPTSSVPSSSILPSFSAFPTDTTLSPVLSLQRETRVLDLFIALKVREDVWLDDSELHLERDESFRDLFDLMQPRSRLEDLVRVYGVREGVVSVPGASASPVTTVKARSSLKGQLNSAVMTGAGSSAAGGPSRKQDFLPSIPFASLSVSFSSRRVGLVLTTRERKKTIVEVERTRGERLEVAARKLAQELKMWIAAMS